MSKLCFKEVQKGGILKKGDGGNQSNEDDFIFNILHRS
jgi:hypothetical protein